MHRLMIVLLIAITMAGVASCKPAQQAGTHTPGVAGAPAGKAAEEPTNAGKAATDDKALTEAIALLAAQERYAFLTFYNGFDPEGLKMCEEVQAIVDSTIADRAGCVKIDAASAANKGLMSKYNATPGDLPLTIAVAPNGAITTGFPRRLPAKDRESAFANAIVSARMADVLLAMQEGKVAAVCFKGPQTKNNPEIITLTREFAADPKFAHGSIVIIEVDPGDSLEQQVIARCAIKPGSKEAALVVIVPPGKVVSQFTKSATAKQVVDTVSEALNRPRGG